MWHAQPTGLTLRLYGEANGYERRLRWQALAKVELLGDAIAYIHATSRIDGKDVTRSQWLEMLALLRDNHGIKYALIERGGTYIWLDSTTGKPAPVDLPGLPKRFIERRASEPYVS